MLKSPESVRRHIDVPPFRHPHFESFRAMQREAFVREVEAAVRRSDELRVRISTSRILETQQ